MNVADGWPVRVPPEKQNQQDRDSKRSISRVG